MTSSVTKRLNLIHGVIVVVALVLVGQLYFTQIVNGDSFRERAEKQYVTPAKYVFSRGSIFFTEKSGSEVSAASLKKTYIIAINPVILGDAKKAYETLSTLLPLDEVSFLTKAQKKDDPYEEIAKRVAPNTAEAISELDITGVGIYPEQWRYYPAGEVAAQTLGFVGYKGDTLGGRYGLEQYYDHVLRRGSDDAKINFFAEVFSSVAATVSALGGGNRERGDLVLTIEPSVQSVLEKELKYILEEYSAQSVGGIIMHPKTGEIYAFGTQPSFDPNEFSQADPAAFRNPLVENVYEMGSIVKPLTVAAGLDAEVITSESTYNDQGKVTMNGATISNYDGRGRGVVDMQEVLNQSLNTGVVHVMRQLGIDTFSKYMRSFSIGEETGIDLPNEARGIIGNLDSPREIEHATASFGQGVAMTPIAMTRALAVLANGGVLVDPHIVKEMRYENGPSWHYTPNTEKRILKESTSEEITRMLVNVVDDALLDGDVKMDKYSIAAKTGTAQIARSDGKGYYDDRYLHTFFGYFPAYEPQFIVFLFVNEPVGVRYASHTLTYPFMNITKFLLNYYEVPPDR